MLTISGKTEFFNIINSILSEYDVKFSLIGYYVPSQNFVFIAGKQGVSS